MTLITQALTIAALVWGPAPCPVNVAFTAFPDYTYAAFAVKQGDGEMYGVQWPACTIVINTKTWWANTKAERCTLIVHEWGHLTGHSHSPDPDNVMYYIGTNRTYWRCLGKWRKRFGGPFV